ncbi:SPOR domain-containing protein [Magnetospirillum molischianum]|uniref:TPR-like protein n=1 Tax=Magnetospirillum molischianum DSM 120 TaxID=1150626 RepID=H8FSF2_MAGML|nr:SPOR domain-containing protein [Magnetospirillum molischianum]CCG41290.1 TPR-like protein [Magnetospirillum molischianum DSM 120]
MKTGRIVLAVLAAGALVACGAINQPHQVAEDIRVLADDGDHTSQALNALTRSEMTEAERHALEALRLNPRDPYALYVAGMVYQLTGRYDLARQYYEALLANRPQVTLTTTVQGMPQVRSLADIAQANLTVVDRLTGRYIPRTAAQSGRMPDLNTLAGEPQTPVVGQRGPIQAQPLDVTGAPGPAIGPTDGDTNVASRFRLLKHLLDEGLITPDEYSRRRAANLGALLPYAVPTPPAQGLNRPAPDDSQVIDRLKALTRTLETRAISPDEHAAERTTILDALLPATPRQVEMPPLPVKGVMEGAAAVGRAERLRASGLISAEEARSERSAVERQLDGLGGAAPASVLRQAPDSGRARPAATAAAAAAPTGIGVILATLKSEEAARTGWARIKAKFPEEVGGMEASIFKVELPKKGTRWQVVAGPIKSREEARKLCKTLRLYRQPCDVNG